MPTCIWPFRELAVVGTGRSQSAGRADAETIAHHLRIFGLDGEVAVLSTPDKDKVTDVRTLTSRGIPVVAIKPESGFCSAFGIGASTGCAPGMYRYSGVGSRWGSRLRSLHSANLFATGMGTWIVEREGRAAWVWVPDGGAGVLFVGTDLAADLVRYRQGDPARVGDGTRGAAWGFEFQRPVYLFDEQIAGEEQYARHADWWAMALIEAVATHAGLPRKPVLPNHAVGAVVITGDDDQAYLNKYAEQLSLLGETPITYFLHPQTRHTTETLATMLCKPWIDLGLHPDAVETPAQYGSKLDEQARWYQALTGEAPLSVRNHGFLNDGYWGHLPHWRRAGIRISSNLPGFDGRVLNGSLLPARLMVDGELTEHWSILTAIGDGIRFASRMSEPDAADCIERLAREVVDSGVPGVIVLNLHPQNVGDTRAMHEAALGLVARGFYPWTMRECLAWFEERDGSKMSVPERPRPVRGWWQVLANRWRRTRTPF